MGQLVPELLFSCDGAELWRKADFQLIADFKDFFSLNCVVLASEDEMLDCFIFFFAVAHCRGDFLYFVQVMIKFTVASEHLGDVVVDVGIF